ncbi:DUF3040 domain-containing protein [Actinomyces massiliensis]|uniref:PF11239 family protein n=1 Tax=Actinomyces massiliensis F0489 TaxID=1125718 RepID=J0X6N3_9ACTO|nr:DUF3040 domain-containing protein [Actinomyces massiliensis]EJF44311.1 PF11239 family protein [Actinomyces massiliensis F0489]WLD73087.1 DUF3040 domain-containing protein [Actinomyces massiliensis]
MALSEREQQVLRDLEEQLHVEDPSLAHTMDRAEVPAGRISPRHVRIGVALVLVGLALVIGGVAVGHSVVSILLGVAGFGVAVWGVTLMFTRVDPVGVQNSPPQEPLDGRSAGPSFMGRHSERGDRRRNRED